MKRTIRDHRPASPAEENADWLNFFADDELALAEPPLIGLDGAPALQAREPAANPLPASPPVPGEGIGANNEPTHSQPRLRSSEYRADWVAKHDFYSAAVFECNSPDDILLALDRTPDSVSEVSIRLQGCFEGYTVAEGFREKIVLLLKSKPSISAVNLNVRSAINPALCPLMLALEAADSIRTLTLRITDKHRYPNIARLLSLPDEVVAIPATTKLTALKINSQYVTDEQSQIQINAWSRFIESNQSLSGLKIMDENHSLDVSALSKALAAHPSLAQVHLRLGTLRPDQHQLLCEGLASSKSITHLHLDAGDPTSLSIAPIFQRCSQLKYLGLHFPLYQGDKLALRNNVNALAILEELRGNRALEHFELLGQFADIDPDQSDESDEFDESENESVRDSSFRDECKAIVRAANEIMRRNRLLAKSADAGDSIAWMTGFQQQHQATLPGNDGSVPFVPSEVGAQTAEAVANMLPVDEAERVFAGLRMRDIRESR